MWSASDHSAPWVPVFLASPGSAVWEPRVNRPLGGDTVHASPGRDLGFGVRCQGSNTALGYFTSKVLLSSKSHPRMLTLVCFFLQYSFLIIKVIYCGKYRKIQKCTKKMKSIHLQSNHPQPTYRQHFRPSSFLDVCIFIKLMG